MPVASRLANGRQAPGFGGANQAGSVHTGSGAGLPGAAGADEGVGGRGGSSTSDPDVPFPFAPPLGKTALLIGQSRRRAHLDYVMGTESVPAGGSVYAELYSGKFSSFEQAAFVDYQARYYPGWLVEVGLCETLRGHASLEFLVRVDYEVSPGQRWAPGEQQTCPAFAMTFRYLKELWKSAGVGNVALVFHPTRAWAQQM